MQQLFEGMLNSLKRIEQKLTAGPREILFPRHQYLPPNAESVDVRQLCDVSANVVSGVVQPENFFTIRANKSQEFIFTQYALYTDAEDASEIEFFFDVQGNRQLRFHGTPNDPNNPTNYNLNMGLGPDLKDDSMIPCYIVVKPQQTLTVRVINRNTTQDRPMGVRIKGYLNNVDSKRALANR